MANLLLLTLTTQFYLKKKKKKEKKEKQHLQRMQNTSRYTNFNKISVSAIMAETPLTEAIIILSGRFFFLEVSDNFFKNCFNFSIC